MSLDELTEDEEINLQRHGKKQKPVCRSNMFLKYRLTLDGVPICCLGGTSCVYLERKKDYSVCVATNYAKKD